MAIIVLAVILVLSQGIQSQDNISLDPLEKLNDVVTSRLKERLEAATPADFPGQYKRLQQAADLPLFQLDEKIMAYNELNLLQRADISSGSTSEPVIRNGTSSEDGPALRQGTYTQIEKQILRLLRRLGIYDRFTVRVFKAIFSDEEQLKKLKKKLDELGKKDKDTDKDNDKDLLWAHIIDLF